MSSNTSEEHGNGGDMPLLAIDGVTSDAVADHWRLCQEAGLLDTSHLTWDSHEWLAKGPTSVLSDPHGAAIAGGAATMTIIDND